VRLGATVRSRAPFWFLPAGFLIGMLGALSGIGGGIVAGPLLHAARKLPLKRAAATALLNVLATTAAATLSEVLRDDSELDLSVALALSIGALLGSELGFRAQRRLDERTLKALFVLVLLLAGARVLLFTAAVGGGVDPGPLFTELVALAIGVAGGFFVPLLGVGGGMIMVPGLFLSLGQLGFSGARACALAAGMVAAVRSLWLHGRAGNVDFGEGWLLALGALIGAYGGVVAAHDTLFRHYGRIVLAAVMLFQAARFALELWRARRAARA